VATIRGLKSEHDERDKIMKCKVCGREYSKWRFCLECGSINHAYTNKNYIGE
jgi:primosomal protein N'